MIRATVRLALLSSLCVATTHLPSFHRPSIVSSADTAEWLRKVSGHDFSRAEDGLRGARALAPAALPQLRNAPAPLTATATRSTLRIGLWTLWHDRQVTLSPSGHATLRACATCPPRTLAHAITLHADSNTLTGAEPSPQSTLTVSGPVTITAHGETLTLHHPLTITARNGQLVLAVTLPIETYVEQVVASESGPADTPESLKALAIAVRTYALHLRHGHADYDLCDSTHCQLLHWSGLSASHPAAHAATLATAGETLYFHDRPALAWFSKDCGGQTASPDQIWPGAAAAPYLPSRPDPYCVRSGSSQWASQLSRADIASALAARGLAPSGWQHLAIARRDPSGRVLTLHLDAHEIPAEDFRLAIGAVLGWNQIPSTWFEVTEQAGTFYFHGRGWGHGVGLCQKGATVMASQHRSAAEILAQYFPGAQPVDDASGRAWQTFQGAGFILKSLSPQDSRYLPALSRARADASQRSGLDPTAAFTFRAFPSTAAFRDATLAPGWIAAFTEGDFIATQPLPILAARRLLDATLLHEFLHALIERQSSPAAPLWLREGLVELWSLPTDSASALRTRQPAITLAAVDAALARSSSESESEAAHQAAAIYADRLITRYGRDQVLSWLRSGVPASVLAAAR
ncbi:MAG TPA: SpoIID/LytB domain-containing protein [Terracidiphilus sp.]|jgi:stage II sporulation protein D|nr:SpoIID/LytB domain-containing protein [Terracidiphilus sp.]